MMLLGIVLHVAISYVVRVDGVPHPWPYSDPDQTHAAFLLISFIHMFRMPAFFVLAGFFAGLLIDQRGRRAFLGNRFLRILLPLVVGWLILWPLTMIAAMVGVGMTELAPRDRTLSSAVGLLTEMLSTGSEQVRFMDMLHLWFLHYLFLFCLLSLPLAWYLARPPGMTGRVARSVLAALATGRARWFRIPVLAVVTFLFLIQSRDGTGIDTRTDVIPDPLVFTTYLFFFLVGWVMYCHRELLGDLESHGWLRTIAGGLLLGAALFLSVVHIVIVSGALEGELAPELVEILGASAFGGSQLAQSFGFWLFVFGIMGLAQRWLKEANPVVRYLVDASYWIYLAHLPLSMFLPAIMHDLMLPGLLKMTLAIVLVTIPLLVTYHFLVRATFIGRFLNGRRYERRLPRIRAEG